MAKKVRSRKGNFQTKDKTTAKTSKRKNINYLTDTGNGNIKSSSETSSCFTKCLFTLLTLISILGIVLLVGYSIAPFQARGTIDFSEKVELKEKFEPNSKLANSVKIRGLGGPESIEEDGNKNLYTGLDDGRIVRIAPSSDGIIGEGEITNLTNGVISSFATSAKEATHGRPLGLRLFGENLFVVDVLYGLYSVNINTKKITSLVSPDKLQPPLMLIDDLCLSKDGKFVYFTDLSATYSYNDMIQIVLSGVCDGRLLVYNVETGEVRTLLSNLCGANGVQLSLDEKSIIVAETLKYRVRIIDTTSWKTTKLIHVPIMPDNIRLTPQGNYLISGASPWNPAFAFLEKNPVVRQIIGGLIPQKFIMDTANNHNIVVEVDEFGEVVRSLQDPKAEVPLTQATVLSDGRLALGSYVGQILTIAEI